MNKIYTVEEECTGDDCGGVYVRGIFTSRAEAMTWVSNNQAKNDKAWGHPTTLEIEEYTLNVID